MVFQTKTVCLTPANQTYDTSLFSVIQGVDASSATLNNIVKIKEQAYNWKMSFNPDRNKQAQEILFSRKIREAFHPNLYFNDQPVEKSVARKHLGLTLDQTLSFSVCIDYKINKTLKGDGLKARYYHGKACLLFINPL